MKFFIKDFFSKYEQIRWKFRICSHLLLKFLTENFIIVQRASKTPYSIKILTDLENHLCSKLNNILLLIIMLILLKVIIIIIIIHLWTLTEAKILQLNIYIPVAIPISDKCGMLIKVGEKKIYK